jgi:hypothetical protein
VAFNIFLCFFLRMRLRRFLIRDPMSQGTLADLVILCHVTEGRLVDQSSDSSPTDGVISGRLNRNRAPPPSAW